MGTKRGSGILIACATLAMVIVLVLSPVNAMAAEAITAHTHKWVDTTKTVHHDEVTNTIRHPAEYVTVYVPEEGHWEENTVTVLVEEEWDEYVTESHMFCRTCKIDLTAAGFTTQQQINQHLDENNHTGYFSDGVNILVAHHDPVYEEQVVRTWVVDVPSHTDIQQVSAAWDEVVVVTPAYDETVVTGCECTVCHEKLSSRPNTNTLKILKIVVSDVTADGYRVTTSFVAGAGVASVYMPTWTEKKVNGNDQDDLVWHTATVSGDTATFYVKTSDHKNESGKYITHVYVNDKKGRSTLEGVTANVPAKPVVNTAPSIKSVNASGISSNGYTLTVNFSAPAGVRSVQLPTWTSANGQDDIVWHSASVSGSTATFYVKTSDHKNESGEYITHVYLYDKNGKLAPVVGKTVTVPKKTSSGTQTKTYVYGGVDYTPVFDAAFYLNKYPDLRAAFGTNEDAALQHFVNFGMSEGRQAKSTFNVYVYRNNYPDLQAAFGSDLKSYYLHYLNHGIRENRKAS